MSQSGRKRSRVVRHAWQGRSQIPTGRLILHNTVGQDIPGQYVEVDLGTIGVETVTSPFFKRIETCEDTLHAGPPYREGGPFTSIKIDSGLPEGVIGNAEYSSGSQELSIWGVGRGPYVYKGGFCNPNFLPYSGGATMNNSSQVLGMMPGLVPDAESLYGAHAWSQTKPQIPKAGLAVFIREARDIPRMLQTTAKGFHEAWKLAGGSTRGVRMNPKVAADHFLNHNFGWVPFIADLRKISDAAINSRDYIAAISRDNGRWIRRRRTLVDKSSGFMAREDPGWFMEPGGSTIQGLMDLSGTIKAETWVSEETHVTTSGLFKYYRPEFDLGKPSYWGPLNNMRRHLALMGAEINPSTVYAATPWTWLIDWFSDVGDHVDLITDWGSDGLVSKYLYLMCHTITTVKFKQLVSWKSGPRTYECSRVIDVKQRVKADSPYGFSLSWGDLSARQLAILGALGISRT